MLDEKVELEMSLKSEIIHSEEQRAYIEILKQALDMKLEELGLNFTDVS
jgi:hypothetical protein